MTRDEISQLQSALLGFLAFEDGERFLITNQAMGALVAIFAEALSNEEDQRGLLAHMAEHGREERERAMSEARDSYGAALPVVNASFVLNLLRRKPWLRLPPGPTRP